MEEMQMAKTVETVNFRLKPDTDEQEFLEQNRRVEQNFVSQQPGFISRETAKSEEGDYIVVLHWERPEDAQASMDKFLAAPDTKDFTALIDLDTFKMTRYKGV
jgi:antibiotic biosynthesis monooxygenase (ABM) superfamily enzyme